MVPSQSGSQGRRSLSLVFVETSGKFLLTISHHILELAERDHAPQLDGSSALVSM
jgi:hypothetical protein